MTETLAMTTATMLRDHFHTSGMTKEVAELDKAIEAEKPAAKDTEQPTFTAKPAEPDSGTFGKAAETHSD